MFPFATTSRRAVGYVRTFTQFVPSCLPCNEAENAHLSIAHFKMHVDSLQLSTEFVMLRRRDDVTFTFNLLEKFLAAC
jgi:hypothetical protein